MGELHISKPSPSHARRLFGECLHHGYVALVLAAMTLILEHQGWLNWLDSISLRIASNVTIGVTDSERKNSESIADRPLTLLISDEMYERDFNQGSPLERGLLSNLIQTILAGHPTTLAIDLDLSPNPGLANAPGQIQLDNVLKQGVHSGTKVILTTPFPVSLDAVIAEKYHWMRKLCESGVEFAFPYLLEMQGVVLRYPGKVETLGRVAARNGSSTEHALCDQSRQGIENAAFLSKDFPFSLLSGHDELATQRPLNPAFFDNIQTILVTSLKDLETVNLQRRVVVLGAGFNPNDQFNTAFGSQKGPVLHAATIFSELHPTHVSHTFSILLDLVLGIAAGFIFHAVWHQFDAHQQKSTATGNWDLLHYLAARGWLLISVAILVTSVVLVTISSAWLFRHNLWNNPGPMIIGFFVKTLIASRPQGKHGDQQIEHHGLRRKLMLHIDQVWFLPIIGWGALLFFH